MNTDKTAAGHNNPEPESCVRLCSSVVPRGDIFIYAESEATALQSPYVEAARA